MPFNLFGKKPAEAKRPLGVVAYGCERHIVRIIQVQVERQGGALMVAETPEEALRLSRDETTNLVLLDSDDPDTVALKEQIEANPSLAHIRVLVLGTRAMVYPCDPMDPAAPATAPATLGELLHWKR